MEYKDKACGLLAVPITRLDNHYLLFYRPELIRSIFWAGNPADSVKWKSTSYSPRDSFERFMQTITNHSEPWTRNNIKAVEYIRSIIVNKQLQDLLQVQAMHDPLTNLLNRLYLDQRLTIEIERAARESLQIAIILMDLDFFKKINDTFGHQAGDLVLAEFAKLLKQYFRGYDYIYRYGGEEFLLLLPGINQLDAEKKR
jgi:GGDEF domain-containing protein